MIVEKLGKMCYSLWPVTVCSVMDTKQVELAVILGRCV